MPGRSRDLFAKVADPRVEELRVARSLGLDPFYREIDSQIAPTVVFEGRRVVMLGSNNYLGLSSDKRVLAGAAEALQRYGTGVTGSRLLNGTLRLHSELEEVLAEWVGLPRALVFTTGYSANLGLISGLVGQSDLAIVDSAVHASVVDGVRLSGGTLRAFRHNRPNSLARSLRKWRAEDDAGGALVAVEGIYSMEGDVAPLAEVAALCRNQGARLLVDEAHSLGVMGPGGAGAAAEAGVQPDLMMATFSKSLASCGGFAAGPEEVIEYLRIASRPLMFTASGVPAALGAALAATRIARVEEWRRDALRVNAEHLRDGLTALGYDLGAAVGTPICGIRVGDAWEAGRLWRALLDDGVYTNLVLPPAMPVAALRVSVTATHSESDIESALGAFERVGAPATSRL